MHLTGIPPARASMSDGLDDRLPTCADPAATIATPSTLGPPGVILRVIPSASKYPRLRPTISPICPLLTIQPSWNVTSVGAPSGRPRHGHEAAARGEPAQRGQGATEHLTARHGHGLSSCSAGLAPARIMHERRGRRQGPEVAYDQEP